MQSGIKRSKRNNRYQRFFLLKLDVLPSLERSELRPSPSLDPESLGPDSLDPDSLDPESPGGLTGSGACDMYVSWKFPILISEEPTDASFPWTNI